MNFGSIAPDEVKVGEQYQFESKYHWCVHATVIENQCGENKEKKRSPHWVGWMIHVDETFGGMSPIKVGKEFSLGWDEEHSVFNNIKIKPVGSMTDYSGFEGSKSYKFTTEEEA
ncbi:hypothetical protein [Bacillus cereus]|uniref:hypothetical protein n=1 Tax=Bacillus cereus TaxID=1396 RepID=UPI00032DB263|nr:hypothetical protein [Bacillus cereus]EOO44370.1 hypothetical protein ICK_06145 [Bacillus cereus BAG1X2-2]